MKIQQIINHFTDDDLYKLSMCCAVIDNFPRAQVKYQFVDRNDTVYPTGFADELKRQIALLENVTITDKEIDFLRRKCSFIPEWFYTYLKGYRFNHEWVKAWQDDKGLLHIEFEGCWADTILLEVKVLAIISELYYIMTNQTDKLNYEEYYDKAYHKAERLLKAGCVFSDFGTRRRASFEAEETAHEFICAIGGMYGPQMANHIAMNRWRNTFRGGLGTYLYDSFGWDIFDHNFSEGFANQFKGLRVDSGNNFEQLHKIVKKYQSLGIDPRTKQIIFSNALDTDRAIEIQQYAQKLCQPSFGIGTHFTNDFEGVEPMNIVIKLIAAKITESWSFYNDTCKISEDKGKHTGKPEVIKRFMEAIHYQED